MELTVLQCGPGHSGAKRFWPEKHFRTRPERSDLIASRVCSHLYLEPHSGHQRRMLMPGGLSGASRFPGSNQDINKSRRANSTPCPGRRQNFLKDVSWGTREWVMTAFGFCETSPPPPGLSVYFSDYTKSPLSVPSQICLI